MTDALLPRPIDAADVAVDDPQAVVEGFLAAMAAGDAGAAAALVADDILYVNVGLPPIRGRRGVEKVLALLDRPGAGFEVYLHATSTEGPVVLTERTDVLLFGRVRIQFWVWGRFEVRDGKITLWRDSFDYLDLVRANVRGVAGAFLPSLRPRPPRTRDTPPGR
ncbi:MAG: limonene-1,2-epoxide hydrolase family protein [Acidimicrobiales bacterium]